MEDNDRFFASFDKAPQFFEKLDLYLKADIGVEPTAQEKEEENALSGQLYLILMEYREQPYLLDPYLERIVVPIMNIFKNHILNFLSQQASGRKPTYSSSRLFGLGHFLYNLTKFRGRKTIVNFFPHEVADLTILLDYIELSDGPARNMYNWRIRYIILLWLSLVCMIPFDLVKFDTGAITTGKRIENLALEYLPTAGLEREAATVLLSKLFARADTSSLLPGFFDETATWLSRDPDQFKATGLLHILCEMTKSGIPSSITPYLSNIHEVLLRIESTEKLANNTVIRKYRIKLAGRLSIGVLPTRARTTARGRKLIQTSTLSEASDDIPEDLIIPDEVESTISVLLEYLQDKSTDVRYIASKYLARIAERLPSSLSEQILDSVSELFSIYLTGTDMDDLPAIAEPTWHGACLACAEFARRGLVEPNQLGDLIDRLNQALIFDVRKGAHSVGSNVRDSAAYAMWALARSQSGEALKPYSLSLARRLVGVSLYDREVHVRRAASAAFQENVGRLSHFPHGIDIIRKADFFAVGNRRNSFLLVAPQIAEHLEYRTSLLDHLVAITLVHWDPAMRQLGAQSLRVVCEKDLRNLGSAMKKKLLQLLKSIDPNRIHGALLGFAELAAAYKARNDEAEMSDIFRNLDQITLDLLSKQHNSQLISASCLLISNALTKQYLISKDGQPRWKAIIDLGLRHRLSEVQEHAAAALKTASSLTDMKNDIERYIKEFPKGSPQFQQSIAYALGELSYDKFDNAINSSITCLMDAVDASSTSYSTNIETRRNCYISIPKVLLVLDAKIPKVFEPSTLKRIYALYLKGFEDYSIDERGDVGSWIRIACIRAVSQSIQILVKISSILKSYGPLESWLPRETYQQLVGGILQQGVERLDNVRRDAGVSFMELLAPPQSSDGLWALDGYPLFKELFYSQDDASATTPSIPESSNWGNGKDHFPKAIQILKIPTYRPYILRGAIFSIGSKTDGTQRPMAVCLTDFAASLPVTAKQGDELTLAQLTTEILNIAQSGSSTNQIVIPVLQTLNALLENGVLAKLGEEKVGLDILEKILGFSTRNVSRLKNIQRISLSGKIVCWLLTIPVIFNQTIESLAQFLLHPFPKVRAEIAEHLYMVLQAADFACDTAGIEEILLETDWMTDVHELQSDTERLITIFKSNSASAEGL